MMGKVVEQAPSATVRHECVRNTEHVAICIGSGLLYSEPPAGQLPVLVNMDFILGNFSWVDYGNVVEIYLPVGV